MRLRFTFIFRLILLQKEGQEKDEDMSKVNKGNVLAQAITKWCLPIMFMIHASRGPTHGATKPIGHPF